MPSTRYSDPALRERLKRRIHAGDKGGAAGQWTARKAQLLAHEYARHGGRYRGAGRTPAQRNLQHWTEPASKAKAKASSRSTPGPAAKAKAKAKAKKSRTRR